MKRRIATGLLAIMAFISSANAQEQFVDPPSQDITSFSFIQLTGGIVIIQACLGNYPDTLNFILDTGSSGISLDSLTVDYLKIKPVPSDKVIRGIAGTRPVSFVYNEKLRFPGLTIDSLNFHINDYSLLTSVYGERIDGIIGYSLLNRYIVKINYDTQRITIATKGPIRYPKGGFLLNPTMVNQLLSQEIRVKDDKAYTSRFMYDMGAGACMLLTRSFLKDSSLFDKKKKKWTKEAEGLGGKIDMELTVLKQLKLGPYKFKNIPVYIFEDENNVTSYPYMCGLVGNDLLRRFNVIINYPQWDIHLIPNSHFSDAFDYSYAGIELYFIDGLIIVGDVAKGSPAEASGVKEGDEVIAVNKNFSQNLNQYKIAMQNVGEPVQLLVRRNQELLDFEFRVRSILK